MTLADELVVAELAADAADAVTLPAFRDPTFAIELKADRTEVTVVDRTAEDAVRHTIAAARPTHAILGEYQQPMAARKNISGFFVTNGNIYWNLKKD